MAIESELQAKWSSERLFESDATNSGPTTTQSDLPLSSPRPDRFFANFPYPYMNGRLHLGHAFSLSKAEFAVSWERQKGKNVLFPFGFHCTGMPIKAAADGLRRELEVYGCPPVFPVATSAASEGTGAGSSAPALKSKVAAKQGATVYKWDLLASIGVPAEEIPRFVDPVHWCHYFPPLAREDLGALGTQIDWRRSFITTDANPYYDAFVGWQFRKLKAQNLIQFGKRHTIYSPKDGQPCMDHDRASGEGVDPEEFTGIKLEVVEASEAASRSLSPLLESRARVYLLAGTLRPETMYGQTNVWVGPELEYVCFRVAQAEYWIASLRAARNLAFQGYALKEGHVELPPSVPTLLGKDLIGCRIKAPLSLYEHIYVLPMINVSGTKGSGIVCSVPSNSPDDYAALRDLRDKPQFRAKYGIKDEHVLPFPPRPIIETPTLGDLPAERAVTEAGIKSQNDGVLLEAAKERVYKEDFYQGSMKVGQYAGMAVSAAKPLIKALLVEQGQALDFWVPKAIVMSRSGDECVVALVDQWYLAYGEAAWQEKARQCIASMNFYSEEVRHQFEQALDWMHQWACSRSYGLGSKLPWDQDYLIESLSDSTIYMAYYMVAHILHQGSLDGSLSPHGIKAEQMTDQAWDYVFGHSDALEGTAQATQIPAALLARMRQEFDYWYPWDLRVSGKDLVANHLLMSIYNHVALFPPRCWPRAIRANGHLLLNSQKMSKSTGNFMTMQQAVGEYGADATRLALADAGDGIEDANFLPDTANAAILRLYTLKEFAEQVASGQGGLYRDQGGAFADKVFAAELDRLALLCVQAMDAAMYRDAVKYGFFELLNARDHYRDMVLVKSGPESVEQGYGMWRPLIWRYLELQARLLAPFCPHLCDWVWRGPLGRSGSILTCGSSGSDTLLLSSPQALSASQQEALTANAYLVDSAHAFRALMSKSNNPPPSSNAVVYVATAYPAWQNAVHAAVGACKELGIEDDKSFIQYINQKVAPLCTSKLAKKQLIPYAVEARKNHAAIPKGDPGSSSTTTKTGTFDELATMRACTTFLAKTLGLASVRVVQVANPDEFDTTTTKVSVAPQPGSPCIGVEQAEGATPGLDGEITEKAARIKLHEKTE